jgi:hypothetical protein
VCGSHPQADTAAGAVLTVFTPIKRLRVFGNIIESMRTDAFLYKTA